MLFCTRSFNYFGICKTQNDTIFGPIQITWYSQSSDASKVQRKGEATGSEKAVDTAVKDDLKASDDEDIEEDEDRSWRRGYSGE